jgi:alanyl-tRNA synthetase
VDY